jgi:hypothetical protein
MLLRNLKPKNMLNESIIEQDIARHKSLAFWDKDLKYK